MSLLELNNKSKEFDFPDELIEEREKAIREFVLKFPLNSIKDLDIDEFVQGTTENSFCYWLEFKKIGFGIGGGNASKFGLYKTNPDNVPLYVIGSGKKKKHISGKELNQEFDKLIKSIILALEHTKNDVIHRIKEIELSMWNMVLQKILFLYYPEKFLSIGASDVIIECARDIGLSGIELKPENTIQINYECKNILSSQPEYKNWHYEKLGTFIWETYLADSKRNYYILGSKYGKNADKDIFPQMLEKEVIATGFASHINLENYYLKNHSEITKYLLEKGEESKSYSA